jgi:hypothetical protein
MSCNTISLAEFIERGVGRGRPDRSHQFAIAVFSAALEIKGGGEEDERSRGGETEGGEKENSAQTSIQARSKV